MFPALCFFAYLVEECWERQISLEGGAGDFVVRWMVTDFFLNGLCGVSLEVTSCRFAVA